MYRSYPQSGAQPYAIIGTGPARIGPDKAEELIRQIAHKHGLEDWINIDKGEYSIVVNGRCLIKFCCRALDSTFTSTISPMAFKYLSDGLSNDELAEIFAIDKSTYEMRELTYYMRRPASSERQGLTSARENQLETMYNLYDLCSPRYCYKGR